ncbi:DsbA family protein [Pyxidicoccus sp. 3LG]
MLEVFTGVVDEELGKAEALVKGGVRPAEVYARVIEKGVDRPPSRPAPQKARELPVQKVGNAPSRGPANAPMTVVAFSDFECPFCAHAVPLPNHPNAKLAAAASLAAHEQGKFWEMHDVTFSNQRKLDRASLEGYAKQLGLNEACFKAALDSGKHDAQVAADASEGARVGASVTPTLFINGRAVVGEPDSRLFVFQPPPVRTSRTGPRHAGGGGRPVGAIL